MNTNLPSAAKDSMERGAFALPAGFPCGIGYGAIRDGQLELKHTLRDPVVQSFDAKKGIFMRFYEVNKDFDAP
ncbi:MAG: hypothetical protein Q8O15_11215 [Rectinemataceae bacterium]|nr:hypothetical protein [Rectinemataceae bacterium]